jgi:hypothetical protein
MAKELGATIKAADAKLTSAERKAYTEMLRTLAAERATSKTLSARLSAIREVSAAAAAPAGTALTLLDFDAAAVLADNQIDGIVSLGGAPAAKPLNEKELSALAGQIKEGAVQFTALAGVLHLRGNALLQLAGGETSLTALRKIIEAGKGALPVWASTHFTDNIIGQGGNFFSARHLSLSTTRFLETGTDLGVAIARTATYMGNSADQDVRLFSLSASAPALAANQGLNIVF